MCPFLIKQYSRSIDEPFAGNYSNDKTCGNRRFFYKFDCKR